MGRKLIMLGCAAAAALSACGKKDEAKSTAAPASTETAAAPQAEPATEEKVDLPAGFPKMTANYKAVYSATMGELGQREMTVEAAGLKKYRFEMPHFDSARAAAGDRIVGVFDDAANRSLMYVEGKDAQKIALVMPQEANVLESFLAWASDGGAPPTKVGSDKIAGLSCDIWETTGDDRDASEACITRDGIILRAGDKGAASPDIVAVSIDKGSRPASSFALPEGFEIVDMGPCQKLMQDAMAAAQSGQTPDMAAMQKCQEIGMKAAAIFGEVR
ncbi:MAG: hypothetical protein ABL957_08085 [Parvularculaceae bacterium]